MRRRSSSRRISAPKGPRRKHPRVAQIASWEDYFIPDTTVLANKLGSTTSDELEFYEGLHSGNRIAELLTGTALSRIQLDYAGFQEVHRYLFQDVYVWAGEPRTTPTGRMTKRYRDVITYPLDDLSAPEIAYGYYPGPAVAEASHQRFTLLASENHLRGLDRDLFIARLAEHWAEINTVHSYREGNTRTQVVFFALLANAAGHPMQTMELLRNDTLREDFNAARFYAQMTVDYRPLAQVLSAIVR